MFESLRLSLGCMVALRTIGGNREETENKTLTYKFHRRVREGRSRSFDVREDSGWCVICLVDGGGGRCMVL